MHDVNELARDKRLVLINKLAESALDLYDLSPSAYVRLLNVSENTTYLVEDPGQDLRMVLRINRPGYHTKEELDAELIWMESIMKHTPIIVPKPIAGKNGSFVQTIKHPDISQPYNCVMFSFLTGKAPDDKDEETFTAQFEMLGEVTALLHRHVQKWRDSRKLRRFTWDYDTMLGNSPRWGRWQDAPGVTSELAVLFQKVSDIIRQRLHRFGKAPDRFGLIHADLRLANLLLENENIKVIDFDDCGFGWYLYDLAAALSFIEHKEYVSDLVASWLKGYRKVQSISREEENEIPTFIMLRRLILLAWLGTHSDSDTARELGQGFAEKTANLADNYLTQFA